MKCDQCENEATVHEVMIKGGKRHERHLCEQCAKAGGAVASAQTHAPITQLLTDYITTQTSGVGAPLAGPAPATVGTDCPGCGMTYAQFRHTGLLGCPSCYAVFEGQLGPLLARAHEGGTHHTGKSPRREKTGESVGAGVAERAAVSVPDPRLATLRRQLAEAVAAEQYEQAAGIRDQLAKLERMTGGTAQPGNKRERGREGAGGDRA